MQTALLMKRQNSVLMLELIDNVYATFFQVQRLKIFSGIHGVLNSSILQFSSLKKNESIENQPVADLVCNFKGKMYNRGGYAHSMSRIALVSVLTLCLATHCSAEHSHKHRSRRTVFDKNLVTQHVTPRSVLKESGVAVSSNYSVRFPSMPVLGYATPWNPLGFDRASTYARKLDIVAPVWYSLDLFRPTVKKKGGFEILVDGMVDSSAEAWKSNLRTENPKIKITPRFYMEPEKWKSLNPLSPTKKQQVAMELGNAIVDECEKRLYNGIVLDSGFLAFDMDYISGFWSTLVDTIRFRFDDIDSFNDGDDSDEDKMILIVVLPVTSTGQTYAPKAQKIDFFSLNTYDYVEDAAIEGVIGTPNAPLSWCRESISFLEGHNIGKKKLLMGINFYGVQYGTSRVPIVGHEFIDLLKSKKTSVSFRWEEKYHEHRLEDSKSSTVVYFPSLQSIEDRLQLARSSGIGGICVWELGQGLEYFFDLL